MHPLVVVTMDLWKAYACLLVILLGVKSFRVPINRNARRSLFTNLLLLHAKGAIDYPNDATDLANIFGDLSNEMLNVSVASISPSMSMLTKEEQLEIFEIARQEQDLQELTQNLKARLQEKWDIENGVYLAPQKPKVPLVNVQLLTHRAKQAFLAGNYPLAIDLYNQAVDAAPCDGRGWQGLGIIYFKMRKYSEAEKSYMDGLYYSPNNPFLLQGYASMIIKLGRMENARKILLTSVKHHPTHAASWLLLADINERKGDVAGRRYCIAKAVDGEPDNFVAIHALGTLEMKEKNYEAARELFQRALSLKPRSVHSLHALAKLEKTVGNYAKALEYYEASIERFPTYSYCYNGKVEIFELQKKFAEARNEFQRGAKFAQQEGDAGFFQSWACFEHRQLDDYIFQTERVLSALPSLQHFFPAKNFRSNRHTATSNSNPPPPLRIDLHSSKRITPQMEDTFLDMLATQDGDKSLLGLIMTLISRAKEQTQFQQPDQPSIPSSSTTKAPQPEEDFISPTVGRTASSAIGGSNQLQKNLTLDQLLSDRDLFLLSTIANTLRSKMREIRRHFHTATRLNKYHSHSWVAWAHFERKLGSSEVARRLLVAGIANFPHSKNIGRFHAGLGALASENGDLVTARACYERALETTPPQHSLAVYLEYLKAEMDAGPSNPAKSLLERALRQFPNHSMLQRYVNNIKY